LPACLRRTANHRLIATGLAHPIFYLEQRHDAVFILSTGTHTYFDFVVSVCGQVVKLTIEPEDLVFQRRVSPSAGAVLLDRDEGVLALAAVPTRQRQGAGASPVANRFAAATAFAHDTPRSA
jgi:hypothetical protein